MHPYDQRDTPLPSEDEIHEPTSYEGEDVAGDVQDTDVPNLPDEEGDDG